MSATDAGPTPTASAITTAACARPAAEQRVAEVRIGLGYTAVRLASGQIGLAYTFRDTSRDCCTALGGMDRLSDHPAARLVRLIESADPIEAAVGLACANAILNEPGDRFCRGDALEFMELRPEDRVAMVGYFQPIVDAVRRQVRSLLIFELRPERQKGLRPAREAVERLPACDAAIITASAIVNHSIDALLRAARGCREVAIVGASAPMAPEAFAESAVTLLSGVVIERPDEVLRVVSEGGGRRQLKRFVGKVCLSVGRKKRSGPVEQSIKTD